MAVIFKPITHCFNIRLFNIHWEVMHAVTFTFKLEINNSVLMITTDIAVIEISVNNRVRIIANR